MKHLTAVANSHFFDEFSQLERLLQEQLHSEYPEVADLGKYVIDSGGKRFRPALVFLFHKLLGNAEPVATAVEFGAIIELIHLATLAHDDVIDLAETRRNRPSLWVNAGNTAAVLEGDFIFSRAFRLVNRYPEFVRETVIQAVEDVLQGELLQEHLRGALPTEAQYDAVNRGKTAALMAAGCVLGAWAGDPKLSQEQIKSIHNAGIQMGSAFQMIDDLMDVFGDSAIGKPTWSDQRGGWLTWPYIKLIESLPSDEAQELQEKLVVSELPSSERDELISQMEQLEIREGLLTRAEHEIVKMKATLEWIPESELKSLLLESSDFVVQRTS